MHARPEDKGEAEDGDERAAQRALGQAVLHLGEEVERAHRRDQAATARAPVGGDGNCRQRTRSRRKFEGRHAATWTAPYERIALVAKLCAASATEIPLLVSDGLRRQQGGARAGAGAQ